MRRNKRIETFERDNALVDIIYNHKGKENAIGTRDLAHALNERGYSVRADAIHTIVNNVMRERHLPICSVTTIGYFWTKSKQDIRAGIDELQGRIYGLQERINLLESFICE